MRPVLTKNPGLPLLGAWVILVSLTGVVPLIASLGILVNVLGVAAGIFILIGR